MISSGVAAAFADEGDAVPTARRRKNGVTSTIRNRRLKRYFDIFD
jgi:hypothetical protein